MKVTIDENLCIGCGSCAYACPHCFELREDGKSHVIAEDCSECDLKEVALDCPVQAIKVEG